MTRDDPAAFAPPPAFGPFRVLHQIGIGALGPVFRTYEPARDRLVAVKLFRLDITPEQAQTLADELARACDAGLFHPSIVEPVAAGVEGTAAYRAEEYVAAESLDVAMRHYAPAPLEKALPFITQLAGAIDFARTAGVGHGALHLRDVFVTPDEARASGFGIVESLERVGIRAPVRRPYSAPERIAGAAWSTPADVFSLAAIAYELMTARRPSGTGWQIGALTGGNIGDHAAAVHGVLARAMADDPADRYSSALAFASALEAAARGGAVTDAVTTVGVISGDIAEAAPHTATHLESAVEVPEPVEVAPMPVEEDAAVDEEDDLGTERDADAAHHEFMRELDEHAAPALVDDAHDEALADLAIEEPPMRPEEPERWEYEAGSAEEPAVASAVNPDELRAYRDTSVMESPAVLDEVGTEAERPRPAMLPMALMLILGLLVGFAAGYALAGRDHTAAPRTATAETPPPAPAAQPASPQPQRSGRAWSEQTVAQPPAAAPSVASPPAETPPVPGDAPPSAAARRPAPGRGVPAATTGRVTVESTPPRASVTINGKWRGRTPLTIDRLAFGTYALRIVQPGFAIAREDVTLSASQPARTISVRLQRPVAAAAPGAPPQPAGAGNRIAGSVYVDSRPRGARIFIDGRAVGTTPAMIPGVSIGSHVVRLELADHRIWTTSTRVAAGQESRVTGSLDRIQ